MNGEHDFDMEDRLRARLRELDGVAVAPYAVLRQRGRRPRGSTRALAVGAAAVVLIIFGAIAGDRLRAAQSLIGTSGQAASVDCGAQASQRDGLGHLVGVTKDATTILVTPLSIPQPRVDMWFDWYMTSSPGTAALTLYAQAEDGSRIAPTSIMDTGPDRFLVELAFPRAGCWRLHSERAGGQLSGDIWLPVGASGAITTPNYANADCSATSRRDSTGRLIGMTADSTAILVGAPSQVRATIETTFEWQMTSGEASPLTVYAEYGDGSRVAAHGIETVSPDNFRVRLTFPNAGCWRLHSERIGGKFSGDIWIQVLPSR